MTKNHSSLDLFGSLLDFANRIVGKYEAETINQVEMDFEIDAAQ
jgi:hypothetical protein